MSEKAHSHERLRMSGGAEVWVDVTPDVAYAALSDLPRMGEWSPDNRGGEWVGANEGAVGATFRGHNRDARGDWETIVTITEADPPRCFAFCVAPPGEVGTTWRYVFRPERRGTVVAETFEWYWTPAGEGFRGRVGQLPFEEAAALVARRESELRASIDATLASLKDVLERETPRV